MTRQKIAELKVHLNYILTHSLSESDIVEYCEEQELPMKEIFKALDELSVPPDCRGCKHIGLFNTNSMYPCNCCSRNPSIKDRYE